MCKIITESFEIKSYKVRLIMSSYQYLTRYLKFHNKSVILLASRLGLTNLTSDEGSSILNKF